MTVGEKIKFFRKSKNLTQTNLADMTGIHLVSIAKYETNKMQPQPAQLKRIASALAINPYALLELEFNAEFQDQSDIMGLVIQFLKNKIMTFEGERLEDGHLNPDTARLLFNEYFMGLFGASSFGGGIKDTFARMPFQRNEINANKLRFRPYISSMEEGLLHWEQSHFFYTQAKNTYDKDPSPENADQMKRCLDDRDKIELSFFTQYYYTPFESKNS